MLLRKLFVSSLPFIGHAATLTSWDDWEHGRVALRDVSIHFRYAGSGPPLLLVHGNPQFSLTWRVVGPILAQNYTVIAPDNRGAGDSSIPPDNNYSATASADDLKGVLDFLNITSTYVFAHDKGVGFATALAAKYPSSVKLLGLCEYVLPGFGYEAAAAPAPFWDLYQNPQLAFFQIPDFAEFLLSGKEKQFLQWYFYHGSYSGPTSIPEDIVNQYTSSISKPGFLRGMLGPFATETVTADARFFKSTIGVTPLSVPVLAMGGEASFGIRSILQQAFGNVSENVEIDIVPKAGHWVGQSPITLPVVINIQLITSTADENPKWVANRIGTFLSGHLPRLSDVDLSWLRDKVTLEYGFYGTLRNFELSSQ
jgi:pimeloyl-ACP methyl ester carboxylesterase